MDHFEDGELPLPAGGVLIRQIQLQTGTQMKDRGHSDMRTMLEQQKILLRQQELQFPLFETVQTYLLTERNLAAKAVQSCVTTNEGQSAYTRNSKAVFRNVALVPYSQPANISGGVGQRKMHPSFLSRNRTALLKCVQGRAREYKERRKFDLVLVEIREKGRLLPKMVSGIAPAPVSGVWKEKTVQQEESNSSKELPKELIPSSSAVAVTERLPTSGMLPSETVFCEQCVEEENESLQHHPKLVTQESVDNAEQDSQHEPGRNPQRTENIAFTELCSLKQSEPEEEAFPQSSEERPCKNTLSGLVGEKSNSEVSHANQGTSKHSPGNADASCNLAANFSTPKEEAQLKALLEATARRPKDAFPRRLLRGGHQVVKEAAERQGQCGSAPPSTPSSKSSKSRLVQNPRYLLRLSWTRRRVVVPPRISGARTRLEVSSRMRMPTSRMQKRENSGGKTFVKRRATLPKASTRLSEELCSPSSKEQAGKASESSLTTPAPSAEASEVQNDALGNERLLRPKPQTRPPVRGAQDEALVLPGAKELRLGKEASGSQTEKTKGECTRDPLSSRHSLTPKSQAKNKTNLRPRRLSSKHVPSSASPSTRVLTRGYRQKLLLESESSSADAKPGASRSVSETPVKLPANPSFPAESGFSLPSVESPLQRRYSRRCVLKAEETLAAPGGKAGEVQVGRKRRRERDSQLCDSQRRTSKRLALKSSSARGPKVEEGLPEAPQDNLAGSVSSEESSRAKVRPFLLNAAVLKSEESTATPSTEHSPRLPALLHGRRCMGSEARRSGLDEGGKGFPKTENIFSPISQATAWSTAASRGLRRVFSSLFQPDAVKSEGGGAEKNALPRLTRTPLERRRRRSREGLPRNSKVGEE